MAKQNKQQYKRTKLIDDIKSIHGYMVSSLVFNAAIHVKTQEGLTYLKDSTISEIHYDKKYLMVKHAGDNGFPQQSEAECMFLLDSYYVSFETVQIACTEGKEQYTKLMFPRKIAVGYDRELHRVEPSDENPIILECYTEGLGLLTGLGINDISLGGIGIKINKAAAPIAPQITIGMYIDAIDIYFPDGGVHTFCGRVRNIHGMNFGVKFTNFDSLDYKVLSRYLLQREGEIIGKAKLESIETPLPKKVPAKAPVEVKPQQAAVKEIKKPPPVEHEPDKDAQLIGDDTPFHLMDLIEMKLSTLFRTLGNETKYLEMCNEKTFQPKVEFIAKAIRKLCADDEDAALGSILLNQSTLYSIRHPIHTAIICEVMGKFFDWDSARILPLLSAALTMNISIIGLQERLYAKEPPLSKEQVSEIRRHPADGVNQLRTLGVTNGDWLDIVVKHHELIDGSGYPSGIDTLKPEIRILSMADVFATRLSCRSYRPPLMPDAAVKMIVKDIEAGIDTELNMAFVKNLGMFVPGTYVRLKNKEFGVVTHRGAKVYRPIVGTVIGSDGFPLTLPGKRDTAHEDFHIVEVIPPEKFNITVNRYQLWGYQLSSKAKSARRKCTRVQTNIEARLLDTEQMKTAEAVITDLSEGGCQFRVLKKAAVELTLNRRYSASFLLSGKNFGYIHCVIKTRKEQLEHSYYGAAFVDQSEKWVEALKSYIETHCNSTDSPS